MVRLIATFVLSVLVTTYGFYLGRSWTTYTIVCPANEAGETLQQSMSNGDEVLCIYAKEPMKQKRTSYKKGKLK